MRHSPSLLPEIRIAAEILLFLFILCYVFVTWPLHQEEGFYRRHFHNCMLGGGFSSKSFIYFCNPVIKFRFDSALSPRRLYE